MSSILSFVGAVLSDAPEHAASIDDVHDVKTPRPHSGRTRRRNAQLARQVETLDVRPPCVEIIDHEAHHEVLGQFLVVEALQDEPAGSGVEDHNLVVERLLKAQPS